MQWILIALGILLAVVAVFALQNSDVATIKFLNLETDASVLVVILLSFAAGVFAGVLALLPSSIRRAGRIRKLGSEVKAAKKREDSLSPPPAAPGPAVSPVRSQPPVSSGGADRSDPSEPTRPL